MPKGHQSNNPSE